MDPTINKTEKPDANTQAPPVFVLEPPKPGDWQIGQMYENAFRVAKKFRTLWILGLIFGAAGGGCSFQFPAGGGSANLTTPSTSPNPEITNKVLGATSSIFSESFTNIFSNIPSYIYFIIGFELLLLIVLWFVIFYLKGAFANVSTIIGTQKALEGQKLTLAQISQLSFPKIKPMAKFMALTSLIIIPIGLIITLLVILAIAKIISVFIIPIIILTLLIFMLVWSISLTFAQRAISLDNSAPLSSIKIGLKMARKKLFWAILVGIINNIISGLALFIPLILINITLVAVGGLIGLLFHKALLVMGIFLGIGLLLSMTIALPLLSSMIIIGKTAIWNQAYTKTKEIVNGV